MNCPHCHSDKVRKYGVIKGKQRYHWQECDRYFQSTYEQTGYHPDVKEICLKMYLNGMGFRGIVKNHRNSSYDDHELGQRIGREVI